MSDDRARECLSSCYGFQVRVGDRRVGIVEDILYGAEPGRPAALLVRGGLLGTRLTIVPVEDVLQVSARSKKVLAA